MTPSALRRQGTLTEPGEAWEIILSRIAPLPLVRMEIDGALGYVLAESVRADRDMPPADRSTMDGYAVRSAESVSAPVDLLVRGEIAAGSPAIASFGPGECVRVFTGANLPSGADAVVRVEDTESVGGTTAADAVTLRKPVSAGAHVVRKGAHAARGDVLIETGAQLTPARIAVCAAVGHDEVRVIRRPVVSILCTGEELLGAGADAEPHRTRDSNGPMIRATLRMHGIEVPAIDAARDDLDLITDRLRRALAKGDAVVLSGGVSVGKYDLVPEAVARTGAAVHVHGVRMKPGKPFLFATAPGGKLVFGLPGNPLSALTALHEFVLPALRRMAGHTPEEARPSLWLPLSTTVAGRGERDRYLPSCIRWTRDGPRAEVLPVRDSGDVLAAAQAEGMVIIPARGPRTEVGGLVEFRSWSARS